MRAPEALCSCSMFAPDCAAAEAGPSAGQRLATCIVRDSSERLVLTFPMIEPAMGLPTSNLAATCWFPVGTSDPGTACDEEEKGGGSMRQLLHCVLFRAHRGHLRGSCNHSLAEEAFGATCASRPTWHPWVAKTHAKPQHSDYHSHHAMLRDPGRQPVALFKIFSLQFSLPPTCPPSPPADAMYCANSGSATSP
jgi:hypothetical protein